MAILEYFLVCEQVLTDGETNSVTLVNVLEEVQCPGFPVVLTQCVAIAHWRAEPGDDEKDWQVLFRVLRPGVQASETTTNFRFPAGTRAHRITQRMLGLPVDREGELKFEITLNGIHQASHVVPVFRGDPPGGRYLRVPDAKPHN